jgi:hypothetical protein
MSNTYEDLNLDKLLYREVSTPEGVVIQSPEEVKAFNEVASENITSGEINGNLSIVNGFLQNKGYTAGVSGWRVDADGIEANNGTFRGTISAATITSANFGGYTQIVDPGDDIQTAVDIVSAAGGGTVFLKNGTHPVSDDITVPSNIYIEGQNSLSVSVDFQNNTKGFIFIGSNVYSTGTLSVNNGSLTVTGSGTVWIDTMVGRSIMISGLWYPIAARVSNTEITLGAYYGGEDVSGVSYVMATTVKDSQIRNLNITRSLSYAIYAQYADYFIIENVSVTASAVAVGVFDSSRVHLVTTQAFINGYGILFSNINYANVFESGSVITSTGDGFKMSNCFTVTVSANFFQSSTGDGINITSCNDISISNTNLIKNSSNGIDFVSGNNNIVVSSCGARSNGSDGFKLTATTDNCIISNSFLTSNGGYGINIAASTCDNNFIRGNQYLSNTSGTYSDSGTGTLADADIENISQVFSIFFGDGSDGDVTISSPTTLTSDMFYNNLTVNEDLNTGGYRIFVKGTLTIASGKKIYRNGNAGDNGTNATDIYTAGDTSKGSGGVGGAALAAGSLSGAIAGENGVNGVNGSVFDNPSNNGLTGNAGTNVNKSLVPNNGASGAAGGAGGSGTTTLSGTRAGGSGGSGGAGGTKTGTVYNKINNLLSSYSLYDSIPSFEILKNSPSSGSGGSGASGGCTRSRAAGSAYSGATGGSGGGGSQGGIVSVFARFIVLNGSITANGGTGGNAGTTYNSLCNTGGSPDVDLAAGGSGGSAGGSGGNGGVAIVVYNTKTGAGTITASGGAGGTGAAGGASATINGNDTGTPSAVDGTAGATGTAGNAGTVIELEI